MIAFSRLGLMVCLAAAAVAQTAPQQPGQTQPPPSAPPPATKAVTDPADLSTGDGRFSIELYYWQTPQTLDIRNGKKNLTLIPGDLSYPGTGKFTPGVMISIPLLKENTIRVSYFRTTDRGNGVAPTDLNLFGTGFTKGDVLSARYTLQSAKISFDYLSYPYPVKGRKFRFKTLYELQYVSVDTRVAAPLLKDSTGASNPTVVTAKKTTILPTFGAAVERTFGRNFRVEANASGFTLPGRSTLWSADGAAALRAGRVEVLLGGKAFHFRTSPNQDNYFRGTLAGGYVGLRYYWR